MVSTSYIVAVGTIGEQAASFYYGIDTERWWEIKFAVGYTLIAALCGTLDFLFLWPTMINWAYQSWRDRRRRRVAGTRTTEDRSDTIETARIGVGEEITIRLDSPRQKETCEMTAV